MADLAVGAVLAARLEQRRQALVQERAELKNPSHSDDYRKQIAGGIAEMEAQVAAYVGDPDYLAYLQDEEAAANAQAEAAEQAQVADVTAAEQVRAELQGQIDALKAAHEAHDEELAALRNSVSPTATLIDA